MFSFSSLVFLFALLSAVVHTQCEVVSFYDVITAVHFNGSTLTNTGTGCSLSPDDVLQCDSSTKLNDDNTGPAGSVSDDLDSFFAFSRQSESDNLLEFTLGSTPVATLHVVLHFYNSPTDSIGLPSISLTSIGNPPIPVSFTLGDNSDLTQTDSTIKNVSLIIESTLPGSFLRINVSFSDDSAIDWFLLSEVDLMDGLNAPVSSTIVFQDGSSPAPISLGPENPLSTVSISCTVAVSGSFEWVWLYEESQLSSTGRCCVWIADATRTSTLVISELRYSDTGNYTCKVQHKDDSNTVSRTNELELNGNLVAANTNISAVVGGMALLQCELYGYLPGEESIEWLRNGQKIQAVDRFILINKAGGRSSIGTDGSSKNSLVTELEISTLQSSDSGEYMCSSPNKTVKVYLDVIFSGISAVRSSDIVPSTSDQGHRGSDTANLLTNTAATSAGSIDSTAVVVGGAVGAAVLVATSLMMVLAFSLFFYFRKSKNRKIASDISLVTIGHGNKTESITAHAEYIDFGAEIQKELEDKLSNSLIDKARLELVEKLGEGEFGVVFRGLLSDLTTNSTHSVAVKTLKGQSNIDGIINEALKMKSFNHLNVLALTGVCLNLKEAPCIVMPFMNEGSLLSYLKREKSNLVVSDDTVSSETTKRLLSMCLQVANGMAYLARMKFVHRDLASRNCMMSSDGIIKVANFGLSEDIYETEYFKDSKSNIKLPIKWMAIESIYYNVFNEKTDVWSYGVLCWEVFSAGLTPYSTMSPKDVISTLNEGRRLEKPSNTACSEEIYSTMLSCWNESSDERPTFAELINKLEYLINQYMDFTEIYTYIK